MLREKKATKADFELKRRLSRPRDVAWWPYAEQHGHTTLRKQEDAGQWHGGIVPH